LLTGEVQLCGWIANSNVYGIILEDDSFKITRIKNSKGDIFQIYSQLAFHSGSTDGQLFVFTQNIYKMSTNGSMHLLLVDTSTITCQQSKTHHCYNSVLFSTVELCKNERIVVKTNNPKLLDRSEAHSFFGIYRLS